MSKEREEAKDKALVYAHPDEVSWANAQYEENERLRDELTQAQTQVAECHRALMDIAQCPAPIVGGLREKVIAVLVAHEIEWAGQRREAM